MNSGKNRGFTAIELLIILAIIGILAAIIFPHLGYSMGQLPEKSDAMQAAQQEQLSIEATQQTGMPAIKNFRERKQMKDILELRDQDGLVTYAYLWNEMQGKRVFLCDSIGYGLPYSTQYTNPQKIASELYRGGHVILPQADPNGLFMPESADGTWVMCKDPAGKDVKPVYVEPRVIISPFKLD